MKTLWPNVGRLLHFHQPTYPKNDKSFFYKYSSHIPLHNLCITHKPVSLFLIHREPRGTYIMLASISARSLTISSLFLSSSSPKYGTSQSLIIHFFLLISIYNLKQNHIKLHKIYLSTDLTLPLFILL